MKTRTRTRTLFMVMLLLAGGAVINIAVAWTLAKFVTLNSSPGNTRTGDVDARTLDWLKSVHPNMDWTPVRSPNALSDDRRFPFSMMYGKPGKEATEFYSGPGLPQVMLTRSGWPCLSLLATATRRSRDVDGWTIQCGLRLGEKYVHRFLPLWPLWPGFVINTMFYAAILWLLFIASGAARRRIRIGRGGPVTSPNAGTRKAEME